MSRKLTSDEHDLWDKLRKTVSPLRRRRAEAPKQVAAEAEPPPEKPAAARKKPASPPVVAPASPKRVPDAPSLARFEEKTLRRLARGLVKVDDRIDLHGMRQERAHSALGGFLRRAQSRGDRIVLVVTGKGFGGEDGRGVLRQSVPHWLAHPDLREFVSGFEEAGRRHGGAGALYVRIRRRREARPPEPRP